MRTSEHAVLPRRREFRRSGHRAAWLWGPAFAGALAGCGSPAATSQPIPAAEEAPKLPCARGTAPLVPVCTLIRKPGPRGEVWTIRFPDGGFRRLLVAGNEIGAADGAEPLRTDGAGVAIGDEHYRLPGD